MRTWWRSRFAFLLPWSAGSKYFRRMALRSCSTAMPSSPRLVLPYWTWIRPYRSLVQPPRTPRLQHVRVDNPVFGECFVCGVRPENDGLGIYAGPVAGREPLHAAPWTASETGPELVWAAIDCPGAYAVGAAGRGDVVLGRMTARVRRVPDVGEQCVVVSWPLAEEGRKLFAGTALFAEDGELLALARQTWITPR